MSRRNNRIFVLRPLLVALSAPLLLGSTSLTGNFNDRVLAAHNLERSELGVAPLRWNEDLASAAKRWADHLAESQSFEHAPRRPGEEAQGENLWAGTAGHYSAEAMVGDWVEEKSQFKPGIFPDNSRTGDVSDVGHFTQLAWRRTRSVGCALARGREEDVLVCRYSAPGNVIGSRPF
jgi:hypothetical protein